MLQRGDLLPHFAVKTLDGGAMTYSLPTPEDLLDWIRYVENQCPECEGEAK
jgi:hypothetical protein